MREEILSAFIRLVAHTPELQGYTASKLYSSLRSDISQESLTLAATWVIGEYSEILLEGGLVDEESPRVVGRIRTCGDSESSSAHLLRSRTKSWSTSCCPF